MSVITHFIVIKGEEVNTFLQRTKYSTYIYLYFIIRVSKINTFSQNTIKKSFILLCVYKVPFRVNFSQSISVRSHIL